MATEPDQQPSADYNEPPAQLTSSQITLPQAPFGTYNEQLFNRSAGQLSLQQLVAFKLSTKQDVMYPTHSFGRGGIGCFLATGCARAGISRIPHGSKAVTGSTTARALSAGSATNSRPWTSTSEGQAGSTGRMSTTVGSTSVWNFSELPNFSIDRRCLSSAGRTTSSSASALKAWEQGIPHPHNFQAACRSTRISDMPAASRWTALSFYENDPAEIRRHLDITQQLDQLHAETKREENRTVMAKRNAWAQQQRCTFRRQRQEVAMRYEMLGIPLRPSQAAVLLASIGPVSATDDAANFNQTAVSEQAAPKVDLPKPTFVKVFDRMIHEGKESARHKAEAWRANQEANKSHKENTQLATEVAELDTWHDMQVPVSPRGYGRR